MIKILFNRSLKAFLPEIDAYVDYFNKLEGFSAYDSSKIKATYSLSEFDVLWEFKGFGGSKSKEHFLIHDYASLSTGYFPLLKNQLKAKLNPTPNLRIFLNENVRNGYHFTNKVDYCYRDMGINKLFLEVEKTNKEYDYIYIGPVSTNRDIHKLLDNFVKNGGGKFCLVGNVDDDIYSMYKNNKDLIFTGKVPYLDVPNIASKAIYGVNYIPDKYPYNIQTSTKLLEYLALGLKVLTTDYKWVRQFESNHGCSFYKLYNNKNDYNINQIEKHIFKTEFRASDFLWDNVIEKSGVIEKLLVLNK